MKTEILVSANSGVAFNGCWHLLLHYIHLTDALFDFILPHIIVINKSITKIVNKMLALDRPLPQFMDASLCYPFCYVMDTNTFDVK